MWPRFLWITDFIDRCHLCRSVRGDHWLHWSLSWYQAWNVVHVIYNSYFQHCFCSHQFYGSFFPPPQYVIEKILFKHCKSPCLLLHPPCHPPFFSPSFICNNFCEIHFHLMARCSQHNNILLHIPQFYPIL